MEHRIEIVYLQTRTSRMASSERKRPPPQDDWNKTRVNMFPPPRLERSDCEIASVIVNRNCSKTLIAVRVVVYSARRRAVQVSKIEVKVSSIAIVLSTLSNERKGHTFMAPK